MVHLLLFPQLHELKEAVSGQHSSFTLLVSSACFNVLYPSEHLDILFAFVL